jgi:hypothetical protein
MNLSPMTTGHYAGITMYQSRYSTRDVDIANGTTTTIAGTIYAPNARVKFAGGASYMQYGDRFIAKSMEISNNAGIGFGGGSTGGTAATVHNLVE